MTEPAPTVDIGGLRGPDNKFHPIEYDRVSNLTFDGGSFRIHAIKYTDKMGEQADGALFELDPGTAFPIMHMTEPEYRADRRVIAGGGTFLAILPSGEIREVPVEAKDVNSFFEQGEGWTDTWVAGSQGLKILDVSSPAFQISFETEITVDDPSLPKEYWDRYHRLLEQH